MTAPATDRPRLAATPLVPPAAPASGAMGAPSPPTVSAPTAVPAHASPGLADDALSFDALAERADRAVAAVAALPADARAAAEELKASVEALHKAALVTLVRRLKADEHGRELLFALVDEPEVRAVLAVHGIIRADVRTRVQRVIAMVRPYMESHGGDVEFVDLRGDRVVVRLHGACNGCSMSAVTLRNTVEEALREHIPGISGVEVVPNEPTPALVTLESRRGGSEADGWVRGPRVSEIDPTRPFRLEGNGTSAILTRRGNVLQAFRNACAHQGLPLDQATIDPEDGTLTCPWHGFRFDCVSGECQTTPQAQLEPLPLRLDGDVVLVRIS